MFTCQHKFRKVKSYFSDFWVGMVKSGHGHYFTRPYKIYHKEWANELSWFFAWWLWCNNFWLGQYCTPYLWLLKYQSIAVALVGPLVVAGRVNQGQSILPSYQLSWCFLGIGSLDFSEFRHGARNSCKVLCDKARFFWKKIFCPQNWRNGSKIGFF